MKKTYYLAYGSNLNIEQMKYRCPLAKRVGTFMLQDYELEFRLYLNVKKSPGKVVPIGVWEITPTDELRLDVYEGYQKFYRKEYVDIEVSGKKEKGLIYIMNDVRRVQPPTKEYLRTCVNGYLSFEFDPEYLKVALHSSFKG